MTSSLKPGSFEDFLRWLGEATDASNTNEQVPDAQVLAAAREAWQQYRSLQRAQRDAIAKRVQAGTYTEAIELMAAADTDRTRWHPRLRTPNGFAISALYATGAPEAAPVGLLVECPVDLIEVFKGQKVHISMGGRWVEIGEIDVDGKATGDLPQGIDFRPPFAFRVGKLEEYPSGFEGPGDP